MLPTANHILSFDPDTDRSGSAWLDLSAGTMQLSSLSFWDLPQQIQMAKDMSARVCIEAGHRNKANFHLSAADTKRTAAQKHYAVGRCHQIGLLLVDYCKKFDIIYEEVLPLEKCWHGSNRKITHQDLIQLLQKHGITLDHAHLNRTNQEERDAALIALTRPEAVARFNRKILNQI